MITLMNSKISRSILTALANSKTFMNITDISRITKHHFQTVQSYCIILHRHQILTKRKGIDKRSSYQYKITNKGLIIHKGKEGVILFEPRKRSGN